MRLLMSLGLALCLLACAGCSKQKPTAELINDLNSPEEKARTIAVRLLGDRIDEPAQVVPALVKALDDKETDVRWSAAIGLGYFGEEAKDAISSLQRAQHDRDPRVREAAGVALARIEPNRFHVLSSKRQVRRQ